MNNLKIPDGWRELEYGEIIQDGDKYDYDGVWSIRKDVNEEYNPSFHFRTIRKINNMKNTMDLTKNYQIHCTNKAQILAIFNYFKALGWKITLETHYGNLVLLAQEYLKSYPYVIIHSSIQEIGGNSNSCSDGINISFNEIFTNFAAPDYIEVPLNEKYTAKVTKTEIAVGCQTFPIDILQKLVQAHNQIEK